MGSDDETLESALPSECMSVEGITRTELAVWLSRPLPVVGPSGVGKTALLRVLSSMDGLAASSSWAVA